MAKTKICKSAVGGFEFTLTFKRIKNINLRVRRDGSVALSAPFGTPEAVLLAFVEKNASKVKEASEKERRASAERKEKKYSEAEEKAFLILAKNICREIDPIFFGVRDASEMPRIEICRGVSRYGYCKPRQNEIRLNVCLSDAPVECLRYVAFHEYCHFFVPNHSDAFYRLLGSKLPNWRQLKKLLKEKNNDNQ